MRFTSSVAVAIWALANALAGAQSGSNFEVFMSAAARGDVDSVRSLLDGGQNVNQVLASPRDPSDGATALIVAAERGHQTVVDELIRRGANVDVQLQNGGTALIAAANGGHSAVVRALLGGGADVEKALAVRTTKEALAALSAAAKMALISKALTTPHTPLMMAAQEGHEAIVVALIAAGANIDRARNDGATALFLAAGRGHAGVVRVLIKAGANPNPALKLGTVSALSRAMEGGHTDVVKHLVDAGAKVTARESKPPARPVPAPTSQTTEASAKVDTLVADALFLVAPPTNVLASNLLLLSDERRRSAAGRQWKELAAKYGVNLSPCAGGLYCLTVSTSRS